VSSVRAGPEAQLVGSSQLDPTPSSLREGDGEKGVWAGSVAAGWLPAYGLDSPLRGGKGGGRVAGSLKKPLVQKPRSALPGDSVEPLRKGAVLMEPRDSTSAFHGGLLLEPC